MLSLLINCSTHQVTNGIVREKQGSWCNSPLFCICYNRVVLCSNMNPWWRCCLSFWKFQEIKKNIRTTFPTSKWGSLCTNRWWSQLEHDQSYGWMICFYQLWWGFHLGQPILVINPLLCHGKLSKDPYFDFP